MMLSALNPQTNINKEPSYPTMDRTLRINNGGWAPSADPATYVMQQNLVSASPNMSAATDAFDPISPCRPAFEAHRPTVVSPVVAPVKEEARNFDVMFQETLLDLMKDEHLDNKEIDDIQNQYDKLRKVLMDTVVESLQSRRWDDVTQMLEPIPLGSDGLNIVNKVHLRNNSWYNDKTLKKYISHDLRELDVSRQQPVVCTERQVAENKTNVNTAPQGFSLGAAVMTNPAGTYQLNGNQVELANTSMFTTPLESSRSAMVSSSSEDDRAESVDDDGSSSDDESDSPEGWQEKYEQLVKFQQKYGHCNVRQRHGRGQDDTSSLALWVKRQRYHHKRKRNGKHHNLTDEREHALRSLGFVFDIRGTKWDQMYNELKRFVREHGHTNVPVYYKKNRRLGIWAKRQRRQYKLYTEMDHRTSMTPERVELLRELGF